MRQVLPFLLFSLACLASAQAEEPVYFPDANLKAAVERDLWVSDPTPTDMLGLTEFLHPNTYTKDKPISDLTGLEYAVNLQSLNLKYHLVRNISALSGLTDLRSVVLLGNRISDVSPLSGLSLLEMLDLEQNEISDISAFSELSNLQSLGLHRNYVSDISALSDLTNLSWVDLRANPMGEAAYKVYLPQIKANNPGITLLYDALFQGQLTLSSTAGGSVILPGEGTFTYEFYKTVMLEARADPHFAFVNWSGDVFTTDNPLQLIVDQNYKIQANFRSTLDVIHVDDDAPGDPGPGNSAVSDPREDGTSSHPFDRIQEAIDLAADGASVFVHAGTYRETIDLLGKHIILTGFDPNDSGAAAWPVLDGSGAGPVVSFTHREDAGCALSGFVITGGQGRFAGAILCSASSPTIANCLIAGNRATDSKGAAVYCTDSNATFVNCTISGNQGGREGAAMYLAGGQAVVANSIVWGNTPAAIVTGGTRQALIHYSTTTGGWPGQGCIGDDPMFADPGHWVVPGRLDEPATPDTASATWVMGDYHLQSQMGRYDPKVHQWVLDRVTSPCIDAGDPGSPIGCEPTPNGGVIDMGVYGGTAEASKTCSDTPVRFPDANLKAAVEEALWISDPTPVDMLGLTQLLRPNTYTREHPIADLTGLEYAVNLEELNLRYHNIRDLSALSGLTNLDTVLLLGNSISDLSPLAGLSHLQMLDLEQNKIAGIAPLAGLSNLQSIGLHRNFVSDISPLSNLTHLTWVDLRADPMNPDAYSTYLPRIQRNNPGVTLLYDAPFTGRLSISSTAGGSVIRPGEGEFTYAFYAVVVLEARADPGFEFVGWSGSCSTSDNPLTLTMDQDYDLRASFRSTSQTSPHAGSGTLVPTDATFAAQRRPLKYEASARGHGALESL